MAKSSGIFINLLGDKELMRVMNALSEKMQKKVVRKALKEGGKIVLDAAQRNAPFDKGKLVRSLKMKSTSKRGQFGVKIVTGTRDELDIPKDSKGYYPAAVEFGSKKQPGKPFLRPAAHDNRQRVFGVIGRQIGKEILKEAKKEARKNRRLAARAGG